MLSPQLRQKVFSLWTMFWSSGMTNPLTSIEQITYLLFLKQLEAMDDKRKVSGKPSIYGARSDCKLPHLGDAPECTGHGICRWSEIRRNPTYDLLNQHVFPWLRELDKTFEILRNKRDEGLPGVTQGIMEDAYFQFPREKAATLQSAVHLIDDLFPEMTLETHDLLGDIFEYLLNEIETSGKNGQFRTPRHLIRFMVELLDPQPGERVIDPAAGTGGFLLSSIQHLLKKVTPSEGIRLEADGTPHRLLSGDPAVEPYLTGQYFAGYDNDRTMVRIGWMNMILHGIETPRIERRDSLGKSLQTTESGAYQVVLANPPFTGSVDKDDLHEGRFPRDLRKSNEPITTKSELLFIWLMLDLLQVGGRAAVIVPEGVLFGSTAAHKELRRQLLFEHNLQAVISLPAGVFQPYTGVKTSILVLQKVGEKPKPGQDPRTRQVWFYEVQADGYSLGARRELRPEPNDLWDALAKFPERAVESQEYYHPEIFVERWRMVDEATLQVFPELAPEKGRLRGIHELFRELPANPRSAEEHIIESQRTSIGKLYHHYLVTQLATLVGSALFPPDTNDVYDTIERALRNLRRGFNEAREMLDVDFKQYGNAALRSLLDQAEQEFRAQAMTLLEEAKLVVSDAMVSAQGSLSGTSEPSNWRAHVRAIVREFAKLDGFDIQLRTPSVRKNEGTLEESRSWAAQVRAYARNDEWANKDDSIRGTHDENGQVRPEYVLFLKEQNVFDVKNLVLDSSLAVLDPDCIEANELNLSAGRYKPFTPSLVKHDSPSQILQGVHDLEKELLAGIATLLRELGDADG